jgi:hypothetical protein
MTFGHAEARIMDFGKWRFMWQIGGMISIRKASERGHANHAAAKPAQILLFDLN